MTSGTPMTAYEKKPKAPAPASCAASETMTLTGLPVSASSEPALPAKAIGMSMREGGVPILSGEHEHHRQEGRDRPVERDDRGEQGAEREHGDEHPHRAVADHGDEPLPGPRRDAGRVERLADDEERGDEDDDRVAEAGEGGRGVDEAGDVERERGEHRHDADGEAVPHEEHDRHGEDEQAGRRRAHGRTRAGTEGLPMSCHASRDAATGSDPGRGGT